MQTPPTPSWFSWFLNTGGALIKTSAIIVFLAGFYNVFMKDDVLEWYTDLQVSIIHNSDSIQTATITKNIIFYIDSIHEADTLAQVIEFSSLTEKEVEKAVETVMVEQLDKRFGPVWVLDTVPVYGAKDSILFYVIPHKDHLEIYYPPT